MSNENGIFVRDGKNFVPAPEGDHNAVCVDVVDLGLCMTPWGEKPKIRIVWELPECLMEDGRPFIVNNRYSPSLDDRSNLKKHLVAWRGKKFTEDELRGFNLENLIGASCKLIIQHSTNPQGKTYANVEAIVKSTKKMEASGKYTRVKDRDPKDQKPQIKTVNSSTGESVQADDIPF